MMNSKINLCVLVLTGLILMILVSYSTQNEAKSSNDRNFHVAKRAITEWRFKRLNPKSLIALDDLFDVIVEFRPKNLDGTEHVDLAHPIKYRIKLVPESSLHENLD